MHELILRQNNGMKCCHLLQRPCDLLTNVMVIADDQTSNSPLKRSEITNVHSLNRSANATQ